MSYLTSLNPQLFKKINIAYVGSFKNFSVQLFFTTRPSPSLTAVVRDIFISFDPYIFLDVFSQSMTDLKLILTMESMETILPKIQKTKAIISTGIWGTFRNYRFHRIPNIHSRGAIPNNYRE